MQDQEINREINELNEVIEEGKSVEEAVEKGLKRLGATSDEVEVEVLEEGTKGVLNLIGGKQAKVIVRRRNDTDQTVAKIEEMVQKLLRLMDISSQVKVSVQDDRYKVDIDTAGVDGLLIGKKGQNLEELTYLVKRMVGKQLKRNVRIEVDVGGYRRRRQEALRNKAISLANKVKSTGREMRMEPLPAAERRIVHLALQGDTQVKTYTVGEGDLKNVVIAPVRQASREGGGKTDNAGSQ